MTRGLIIPAIPFVNPSEREFGNLAAFQQAVDGYIEPIVIQDPPLVLYVNEDGRSLELLPNPRATVLWWLLDPEARGRTLVLGDAVVTADPDADEGERFMDLLQCPGQFAVEVKTVGRHVAWSRGPAFDSWFIAAACALEVKQDNRLIREVRVLSV